LDEGVTTRLYLLPAGRYRWGTVRGGGLRYELSKDEDAYAFTVEPGVINYPGHLVYRELSERRVLVNVANRGLLAMDWLRQAHPRLAQRYALEYRGHYPDPFPAFHREHGAGTAATADGRPAPRLPGPLPLPVEVLWKPGAVELVDLNPGGDLVAVVERDGEGDQARWLLRLVDLRREQSTPLFTLPVEVRRIDWSSDRSLLLSCVDDSRLDALMVVHLREESGGWTFDRLNFPYRGRLIDALEDDPEHVLFASTYVGTSRVGMQVHRVPISSQRALNRFRFSRDAALDRSVADGRELFADGAGELRAAIAHRDDHHARRLGRAGQFNEVMVLDDADPFATIALSADGNLIYGSSEDEREQRDLVELDP